MKRREGVYTPSSFFNLLLYLQDLVFIFYLSYLKDPAQGYTGYIEADVGA